MKVWTTNVMHVYNLGSYKVVPEQTQNEQTRMLWVELTFAVKFCTEFVYPMMMRRTLGFQGEMVHGQGTQIQWVVTT